MVITPDGSPSMQEYRKKVLEDMVQKTSDAELDGYQLFDMIVAKWGVPYGCVARAWLCAIDRPAGKRAGDALSYSLNGKPHDPNRP